jgi:hypothetical protein
MSDHSRALVPIASGLFSSPELEEREQSVDIGLLAEALIYYDQILLNVDNQKQFGDLISWFLNRDLYTKFLDLLNEGTIQIYNRAFRTNVFVDGENAQVFNNIEEVEKEPFSFFKRYLGNDEVTARFPKRKQLYELREAAVGKVIEVKVEEFGRAGIENAERDFLNPRRCPLLLQAVVDELYRVKALGPPPEVRASIIPVHAEKTFKVHWDVDFEEISRRVGKKLAFGPTLALSGAVIGNLHIWAARQLECDLYLPSPISAIVGDKLYEASQTLSKTPAKVQSVVDQLEAEVEFPDVHSLINSGGLEFKDVLRIRKKAKRFRKWLQEEGERDRNALYAYHFEVAKESGFTKAGRKLLRLFGTLGGPTAGAAVATVVGQNPIAGAAAGTAVGEGVKYLFDVGSKLGEEWKPVVFGNWYKGRIEKLLNNQSELEQ